MSDYNTRKSMYERVLGKESAFHNPYTFIPFPLEGNPPKRSAPTPLTADEEAGAQRYTGVLELEVTTQSPLMTCEAEPYEEINEHKKYRALTIGEDVILPATGVRGSLRSLLTIIAGGTLGYLDEDLFLCQGRDLQMAVTNSKNAIQKTWASLGIVVKPGSRFAHGVIAIGDTRPVQLPALEECQGFRTIENDVRNGKRELYIDNPSKPVHISHQKGNGLVWRVKLSGKPIQRKKSEAAINVNALTEMEIPSQLWRDYTGRHRLACHTELRKGDLVWLELRPGCQTPASSGDIVSLQWARWGRKGQSLRNRVPEVVWPDYLADDGKVDEVTDLFGQVSPVAEKSAPTFASRIRSENLVFQDARQKLIKNVHLAPLAQPHPGCRAFYRDTDDPRQDAKAFQVRGYKVYRTTTEPDAHLFSTQGVYDEQGRVQNEATCKMNKTVELLPAGQKGVLHLALRSLSARELAILLSACSVPWRLGGGKPLGLGACSVKIVRLVNELGDAVELPRDWPSRNPDLVQGMGWWKASQQPVDKVRYPRAVANAGERKHRGGHTWFGYHATPKKGPTAQGLEPVYMASGDTLPGQCLPLFDANQPRAGVLYGYDMYAQGESKDKNGRTIIQKFVLFDPSQHATGQERSRGNTSQNRESRQAARAERGSSPEPARPTVAPAPSPRPGLEQGKSVPCVICEDPKGQDRLFARHEPTGRVGFIQSAEKIPEDCKKIGAKVTLYVKVASVSQVQFEYRGK